ncbi:hypothetical protein BJ085DRAFT_29280 [Dimargaris cristalligena]|uniref:Uncharacterized protein n=1 Tax=Dimargaris cristalligena TaxID=215637 RepID=A0A4P9ZRC3_9FUNG|nr:hypothetical protein BJ085DRAFT_29280 [Dimargaris cristalligena]|eukprot:RKP35895.1 hypothetical protein BJ085DRAFT_29280 [Dimargaris cristalligena]
MASPDPLVAQLADVLDLLTQARTSQARHWSMHDIRRFEATCRHVAQTFTTTTTTTGAQQQDLYHYLTGEPVLNDPLDNRDSNPRLLGFSDSEAADRWDGGQSASVLDIVSQMVEDLDTDQSTIVVDDSLPDEDFAIFYLPIYNLRKSEYFSRANQFIVGYIDALVRPMDSTGQQYILALLWWTPATAPTNSSTYTGLRRPLGLEAAGQLSRFLIDHYLRPILDKGPKTVSVSTGPARPSSEQRLWLLDHGPFVPARVARRNPWFAEFYSTWLRQFISKSGPDENSGGTTEELGTRRCEVDGSEPGYTNLPPRFDETLSCDLQLHGFAEAARVLWVWDIGYERYNRNREHTR